MSIGPEELDYVRDLVFRRSAIVLEPAKQYLVESRLARLVLDEGCDTLDELVHRLQSEPPGDLHARVVEAMTTNETSFFRDLHPFEALREHVIPALVAQREATRSLFVWCAAASTGQEAYTIAMILREHFPALAAWSVRIVATDLSTEVLARARAGIYRQFEINRGLPEERLRAHFEPHGIDWRIRPELRAMVEFRQANLIDDWGAMPTPDLVFLRNVLIYFDVPTKRALLGRVHDLLARDGVLFLGGSETTSGLDDRFERIAQGKAVYYRRRDGC